jgi:hypothetical protein
MNDDPIDRFLGRLKEAEIPAAPANLETKVLRNIRSSTAATPENLFALSWRLPACVAALAMISGWVASVSMPPARLDSPERARLALSLESFHPSMVNLAEPFQPQ